MININISFLVVAYIVGLFVDWVFQNQWQAVNKSKWQKSDNKLVSFMAVSSHSFIYAGLTAAISLYLINQMSDFLLVFVILFISHAIIDTRILVKLIMRWKGLTNNQIMDYQNYGFMHIGIDHRLHELVILILAILI